MNVAESIRCGSCDCDRFAKSEYENERLHLSKVKSFIYLFPCGLIEDLLNNNFVN